MKREASLLGGLVLLGGLYLIYAARQGRGSLRTSGMETRIYE